ncbi:hypothetical protein NPX13_g1225 [Xylaria arbuscula]|uniref:Fungal N-terminal domain-containing protein n=1 Tax=Xylaria arbuscula TaxID=114810 RepID=A0A9W8TRH6_9PEZI|nr:hypothetical protein NPX13_g1225 [Xylaria arbuscula]
MAEAFAAAASAAGIVSLGLEVCEGLSTYVDAFRNRGEDISAINRQVGSFQSSLAILRDALPGVDVKHQTAGNTAQAALDSCQLELNALKAFMDTLGDPITQSHTFESSLTHAKKKLAFPFHRKKLEALQKRVMIVDTSLDVATCGLGLKIISSIENLAGGAQAQLSYISTISAANGSTSTSIKTALDTALPQTNQALIDISDDLGVVKASLPEIKQDLNSLSQAVSRSEANSDSLNSAMSALAVTVANSSPSPELLSGIIRAAEILNNLVERKESDPPEILGALPQQRALSRLVASPAQLEQVVTLSRENDDVTGSGGLGISPNITFRPIIDESQAPVFQALRLIVRAAYSDSHQSPSFILQFTEVVLVLGLNHLCREYGQNFTVMTRLLLEAGLPVSLCDDGGSSAGSQLLSDRPRSIFDLTSLMCILCEEASGPSNSLSAPRIGGPGLGDIFQVFCRLHSTQEGIEILGCGPLSTAIILQNEAEVKSLITSYPSTIHEKNVALQTPFHFASNKPAILKVLIGIANPQELDCQDAHGNFALDYALRYSSIICENGNSWRACFRCPCTRSIDIFLSLHWRCRIDFLLYCDSEMSHTARLRMIDHLVSQRAELKALGHRFLPSVDTDRVSKNDQSVLDSNAHRVAALLLRNGVNIPTSVRATLLPLPNYRKGFLGNLQPHHGEESWVPPLSITCDSIYHNGFAFRSNCCDNKLANLLYEKGFHDVDSLDKWGQSPLLKLFYCYYPRIKSWPSFALWLINHGADIMRPFPISYLEEDSYYVYSACTIAHVALGCVFTNGTIRLSRSEMDSFRQLVSLVAPLDIPDACNCHCVETGCHTMKLFFEELWGTTTERSRSIFAPEAPIENSAVPEIAKKMSGLLRDLKLDLSEWHRVAMLALRYFTFEALEIQHTCCRVPLRVRELSEDDIADIEEENREKIELLETTLQDLHHAYCDFEHEDNHGGKVTSFLTAEWAPRMQRILADQEAMKMTEDERVQAEQIGVRWRPAGEDDEKVDRGNLEYWLRRLDEIMPDERDI